MRSPRLGIAVVLVGAGSACSALGGDDADPASDLATDLATDLAAALPEHSLGDVPLGDESQRATFDEREVGAKTGTAEHGEPDASGALPTHAWMMATRGDLAVAVFVGTGVSGSQTAGPVLEAFLR